LSFGWFFGANKPEIAKIKSLALLPTPALPNLVAEKDKQAFMH
jgi:hypothetical protein